MQIHQLKPNTKRRDIKRIGRGGKRGTYSGRGQKGQKARAGHRIRPALRDTLIKIPKLRGYHNKPKKEKPVVINLSDLNKISDTKIDRAVLENAGLLKKSEKYVKILAKGEIKDAKNIVGIPVSASAKKKIEAAGGSVA
jgi:large subunit ribosomal protein L15